MCEPRWVFKVRAGYRTACLEEQARIFVCSNVNVSVNVQTPCGSAPLWNLSETTLKIENCSLGSSYWAAPFGILSGTPSAACSTYVSVPPVRG